MTAQQVDASNAAVAAGQGSFMNRASNAISTVASSVGGAMAKGLVWSGYPLRAVKDYYTAAVRTPQATAAQARQGGGIRAGLGGLFGGAEALVGLVPGAGFVFPEFRRQWDVVTGGNANPGEKVRGAGSLGQTLVAPFHDPNPANANPYDFLDDPKFAQPGPADPKTGKPTPSERDLYFSSGTAKWVSGIADMSADLTMDPLIAVGKGAEVARAAHNAVSIADVAKAADAAANGVQATGKASRLSTVVTRAVDASERVRAQQAAGVTGGYARMASTKTLSGMTDGGSVAAYFKAADDIADPAARIAAKVQGVYAALGDPTSLSKLRQQHEALSLQLESLAGPDRTSQIDALLADGNRTFAQRITAVDSDDYMQRLTAAYEKQIQAEQDSIERVIRMGSGGTGTGAGKTSLTGFRLTESNGREFTQVARSIKTADGLPPIHVVGRALAPHAPTVLSYDDAAFLEKFTAHIGESRAFLRGIPGADEKLGAFLDRAATAHAGVLDPEAARAGRAANGLRGVVDDYKNFMTTQTARHVAGIAPGAKMTAESRAQFNKARQAITDVISRRDESMANLGYRAYQASADKAYIATQDSRGVLVADKSVATPFAPSQFDNSAVLTDYQHVARTMANEFKDGLDGWLTQTATGAWGLTQNGLDKLNDLWKFGTLFRAGYTLRTQVDTQARLLAVLGPFAYLHDLAAGGFDFTQNARRITADQADWATRVFRARQRQTEIALEHPEEFNRAVQSGTGHAALVGQLPKDVQAEWDTLEAVAREAMPVAEKGAATVRAGGTALSRYIGKPTLTRGGQIKGDMATAAYRDLADMVRQWTTIDAKASVLGLMTTASDAHRATLLNKAPTGQFQPITADNSGWAQAWADYVNKFIRTDHMGATLARRWDDPAVDGELAAWLRGAEGMDRPDVGRAVWQEISTNYPGSYENPEDLVAKVREQVQILLPDEGARARAMERDLTKADAEELWAPGAQRPAVPAERMQVPGEDVQRYVAAYNGLRQWWFKHAGDLPETMWGRHPFYADRKAGYMRSALDEAAQQGESITVAEYNQIAKRAGLLAKKDVSTHLFDTSQRSNLNYSLRFLSPFYSAWSDTMRKWALIMGEHPVALGVGRQVMYAPRKLFVVTDADGNQINADGTVTDNSGNVVRNSTDPFEGYLNIGLPSWVGDIEIPLPGGGKFSLDPAAGGSVKVPLSALNLIFQGQPFWLPGPGPMATMPVNELAKRSFPEVWDNSSPAGQVLRFLLPYGLDANTVDEGKPAWYKNLMGALGVQNDLVGIDTGAYAQTLASLMAEEQNAEENGLRPRLSQGEMTDLVANRVRNWYLLKLMGSESGLNVQPTTRLDYWRQEYQRYNRVYPNAMRLNLDGSQMSARQAFYEDHPDYFDATLSLSVNDTGISATDESWPPTKKYLSDIKADPQWGWMYVGAANLAPGFDSGVYTAQKSLGLRTQQDPKTAFTQLKVSQGWMDWNKVNGQVQTLLADRAAAGGSASLSAKSNADLADIRKTYQDWLEAQNPQWANAYEAGNGGANANAFLRAAAGAVEAHPELLDRSDFQLLEEYMQIREKVQAILAARGLSQITSKGAEDLREILDLFTSWAVNQDLGFQQMYNRGDLGRDTVGSTPITVPPLGMSREGD